MFREPFTLPSLPAAQNAAAPVPGPAEMPIAGLLILYKIYMGNHTLRKRNPLRR
jgi:hypothetical protein